MQDEAEILCPYCGQPDSRVVDTRSTGDSIRRRRECQNCRKRFTTYEQISEALLAVLDALLDAGDIAPHRIEAPLHQIEALGQFVVPVAQALDGGIGIALLDITPEAATCDFRATRSSSYGPHTGR
mgnify:CR=1 FL=1